MLKRIPLSDELYELDEILSFFLLGKVVNCSSPQKASTELLSEGIVNKRIDQIMS